MKDIVLADGGDAVSMEMVNELESKIKMTIPNDYKEFLVKNNGGYPKPRLITPKFDEIIPETKEIREQQADVASFLSIKEIMIEYEDILDEDYIPHDYLPFAMTSFDNYFLINVGASELNGEVYYSNHDLFDYEKGGFTLSKVADSFSDFIEKLDIFKI